MCDDRVVVPHHDRATTPPAHGPSHWQRAGEGPAGRSCSPRPLSARRDRRVGPAHVIRDIDRHSSFSYTTLQSSDLAAAPNPQRRQQPLPRHVSITDEASPFALRSTRNRPRTAMHQGCVRSRQRKRGGSSTVVADVAKLTVGREEYYTTSTSSRSRPCVATWTGWMRQHMPTEPQSQRRHRRVCSPPLGPECSP
jgi:hypothetical protein